MKVTTVLEAAAVTDDELSFFAIFARLHGEWLMFCRDGGWLIPMAKVIADIPTDDAARGLICETVGASDFDLRPAITVTVEEDDKRYLGRLYLAEVRSRDIALLSENVSDVRAFAMLPRSAEYPEFYAELYEKLQCWINLQNSSDELWDVYDISRQPTGRLHRRGELLLPGEYHLAVHIWIRNSQGEFLLTQRSERKGFPFYWETAGGSAVAGDDSLTAALREAREETGINLAEKDGRIIFSYQRRDYFCDVWLFDHEFSLDEVVLQPGETRDAMCADISAIERIYCDGKLFPYDYIEEFIRRVKSGEFDE